MGQMEPLEKGFPAWSSARGTRKCMDGLMGDVHSPSTWTPVSPGPTLPPSPAGQARIPSLCPFLGCIPSASTFLWEVAVVSLVASHLLSVYSRPSGSSPQANRAK